MSTVLIIINLCILGVLTAGVVAFAWMLYADRKADERPNAALDSVYMDWLEKKTKRAGGFLLHDGNETGRVGLGLKASNGPARTLRQAVHEAMGNAAVIEDRRSKVRKFSYAVKCTSERTWYLKSGNWGFSGDVQEFDTHGEAQAFADRCAAQTTTHTFEVIPTPKRDGTELCDVESEAGG